MINMKLAKARNLSEQDILDIKVLHEGREYIEAVMRLVDSPATLQALFKAWTDNEYALQEKWGFARDANYHKWWYVPKCSCPKLDNDDAYPLGYYAVNMDCPVHGYVE